MKAKGQKLRVVVDTNCLILSINAKGAYFWLYEAFRDEKFTWIVSSEILLEYEEILTSFYSEKTAKIVLAQFSILKNVEFVEPFFRYNFITKDPDDNKFADLAISANAHYLVSNDAHFKIFKKIDFPKLSVLRLEEFKKIFFP